MPVEGRQPHVLLTGTRLLGNKTYMKAVHHTLAERLGVRVTEISIVDDDYKRSVSPIHRLSDSAWAIELLRQKLAENSQALQADFDVMFTLGWEGAFVLKQRMKHTPSVLMMDAPPLAAAQASFQRQGRLKKLASPLRNRLVGMLFRQSLRHVDMLLPWSLWCADRLINDHGISPDSIRVTYFPLDLDAWRPDPAARAAIERKFLLFVGNDFERKGGRRLIAMHQRRFADDFDLVIASHDASAADAAASARNVRCLSDLETADLLKLYQTASAFVLPTEKDCCALVLSEALGAGTPCIATGLAAIPEFVRDGISGYTLAVDAADDDWIAAIEATVSDEAHNIRLSHGARSVAEQVANPRCFSQLFADVIDRLAPSTSGSNLIARSA